VFSASIDKQFKVYDVPMKMCIRTIQTPSPISKMMVDYTETMAYMACDNQNIYCYNLELASGSQAQNEMGMGGKNKHKRTLQHKKKVSAMTLSMDG